MTFSFRPAKREQTPLIVGLAGPSKSGKTYSAFRLATGIAAGGKIAMINSEGARGHMYADKFKYETVDIDAPFGYDRYKEALLAAKEIKPAVVIIDSISHAHEGEGGMLDQHEQNLDRMMAKNPGKQREQYTWSAWIKPKALEADFINTLIRMDFSIILCFRAKEKLKIIRGKEPIPMGWQPICSDRIPFETTATLILPPGSKGVPDMGANASELREPLDTMIKGQQLDENLGRALATWANGKTSDSPEGQMPRDLSADPPEPPGESPYITDDEVLALDARCTDNGINVASLRKAAGVERLAQIKSADLPRAHKWIDQAIAKRRETV